MLITITKSFLISQLIWKFKINNLVLEGGNVLNKILVGLYHAGCRSKKFGTDWEQITTGWEQADPMKTVHCVQ